MILDNTQGKPGKIVGKNILSNFTTQSGNNNRKCVDRQSLQAPFERNFFPSLNRLTMYANNQLRTTFNNNENHSCLSRNGNFCPDCDTNENYNHSLNTECSNITTFNGNVSSHRMNEDVIKQYSDTKISDHLLNRRSRTSSSNRENALKVQKPYKLHEIRGSNIDLQRLNNNTTFSPSHFIINEVTNELMKKDVNCNTKLQEDYNQTQGIEEIPRKNECILPKHKLNLIPPKKQLNGNYIHSSQICDSAKESRVSTSPFKSKIPKSAASIKTEFRTKATSNENNSPGEHGKRIDKTFNQNFSLIEKSRLKDPYLSSSLSSDITKEKVNVISSPCKGNRKIHSDDTSAFKGERKSIKQKTRNKIFSNEIRSSSINELDTNSTESWNLVDENPNLALRFQPTKRYQNSIHENETKSPYYLMQSEASYDSSQIKLRSSIIEPSDADNLKCTRNNTIYKNENSSDSGVENDDLTDSRMAIIKCKDAHYLAELFLKEEGIHGLRVIGRVGGVGRHSQDHVMSVDQLKCESTYGNSSHCTNWDDVRKREMISESTTNLNSQSGDTEFVHETADYQWLLDYEYRECYARDCLGSSKDSAIRTSVLQHAADASDLSYEALSRDIDASLAHIDIDDFRSEDIHQLLSYPTVCEDGESEELRNFNDSVRSSLISSGVLMRKITQDQLSSSYYKQRLKDIQLKESQCSNVDLEQNENGNRDEEGLHETSGDGSLYCSGPLFSPVREPQNIPPSFSVDSLDSESIHEDLILTCQANKNNYTIAFEGSFLQCSGDSDYEGGSDANEKSGNWERENLRIPASTMTFSDQPYTTWSRVGKETHRSYAGDNKSTATHSPFKRSTHTSIHKGRNQCDKLLSESFQHDQQENKSNSLPNLMRPSLMKESLEAPDQCMKVYDLQQSFRSSQLNSIRSTDGNNFSLVRLFIKQKCNSKEAVSTSSSLTDPLHGVCSSSDNHSCGNDSSDWPMNSQSENDMDRSASPVPLSATNNHIIHGQTYNRRDISLNILAPCSVSTRENNKIINDEIKQGETLLNNNNNNSYQVSNEEDSTNNGIHLEINLKDASPCSKAPLTSPIKEEPESLDMSMSKQCDNPTTKNDCNKLVKLESDIKIDPFVTYKNVYNNNVDSRNSSLEANQKLQDPTAAKHFLRNDQLSALQRRRRHDSGSSSSEYSFHKDSTDKFQRAIDEKNIVKKDGRPKPKPRLLRQLIDQSLQTSNFKVSTAVNTSCSPNTKEVYIYYPNYALPNLDFLKQKSSIHDTRVFLVPQHYRHRKKAVKVEEPFSKRPYSCGDLDKLRKLGFSHIKDWNSLNFLLPKELKELLFDDSECMETKKPSFCSSSVKNIHQDQALNEINNCTKESKTISISSSSTQPSSGYKGSSTLLNDSAEDAAHDLRPNHYTNTAFQCKMNCQQGDKHKSSLPKKMLRKENSLPNKTSLPMNSKLYGNNPGRGTSKNSSKRYSLQEPIGTSSSNSGGEKSSNKYDVMNCSCNGKCTDFCTYGLQRRNLLLINELSDSSTHETFTEDDVLKLRSQVSEFLVKKGRYGISDRCSTGTTAFPFGGVPKKSVSFEGKSSMSLFQKSPSEVHESKNLYGREKSSSISDDFPPMLYDAHDKKTLVLSVRNAVEKLVKHFNRGRTQQAKNKLGTSSMTPEIAQLSLDKLCPAIYALLSDGLLPSLHSLFGKIPNSVWRVIEATSHTGPSTKALNDLVLTLNSEDFLSEGPMKFNAFIFGLLNIRSLDAWLSYLRTRESALQKHYHPEAFLYLSNTAMKGLYDDLLLALRPLALLPFKLDLMHESKALHASMMKMEERLSLHSSHGSIEKSRDLLVGKESKDFRNAAAKTSRRDRSPRPRSCHESTFDAQGNQSALKKRWSGVQMGSKFATALDKLMAQEKIGFSSGEYSDSLEISKRNANSNRVNASSDEYATDMKVSEISSRDGDISECSATYKDTDTEKGIPKIISTREQGGTEGKKFRKLQLKWEAMTGRSGLRAAEGIRGRDVYDSEKDPTTVINSAGALKSKIPRPVNITSPSQAFMPFDTSKDKISPQTKNTKNLSLLKEQQPRPAPRKSLKDRVLPTDHHHDSVKGKFCGDLNSPVSSINRASSVPGRKFERSVVPGKFESQKNFAFRSASQGRRDQFNIQNKLVQTLHHRMATDNGHLSFNRGDILSVVVEVDERFILCSLQDRKGLVPRSSVILYEQH